MPTYEYLCNACGHEFEREQRITDDPLKTCPECKKRKVERLISRTSFVLKGGGWYNDLYSSQKPGKDKDSGTDSSPDATSDSSEKKKSKKDGSKKDGKKGGKKGKGAKAAA